MLTWFGNLKTMVKLMLGFSLVGAIMAFVGYVGIANMGKVNESLENVYVVQLKPLMTLTKVRGMVYQMRSQTLTAVLTSSAADRDDALAKVRDLNKQVDATREEFVKTIKAEAVQKAYDDFARVYDDYRNYRDQAIFKPLASGDQKEAIANLKGEAANKFKASIDAINTLVDVKMKVAQNKYDEANKIYADSRVQLTGIIIGGVVIGLFIGWAVARMIASGLSQVNAIAQKAANGDLSDRVHLQSKDELGMMGQAFNSMLDGIAKVVSQVRMASENISSASTQISTGTQDLSQRTSEQASSLEETSSAMEEMTATVKQNADNAKQANQLGIAARDVAEQGGTVVARAVTSMDEINKSSKKIADIITVIDEIAFQTNLLALNAAVEAARAGEHGRGFAVVASEVRNLAQRSATAAKEIKSLINESVQKVSDGSELVNQSGKTLEEIVSSVKRVTDILAEISAASQEQATGIDQVNKAIMQMDEVTQQNAALVEESAAASEGMQQQSAELLQTVGFFKLGDHTAAVPAHATPAPRPARPEVKKPMPASKPAKNAAAKSEPTGGTEANKEPVGVGTSNGHDRRRKNDDFEEF